MRTTCQGKLMLNKFAQVRTGESNSICISDIEHAEYHMVHKLIELTKWLTLPAPFSSVDAGEAWVWGDFFAVLQTQPKLVGETLEALTGKAGSAPKTMEYPFAMSVFYHKSRNPHGPSSRPILVIGLERADYSAAAKLLGMDMPDLRPSAAPIMVGIFTGESHLNLGVFDGYVSIDTARSRFFKIMGEQLGLIGVPKQIGVIADVFGHPDTGYPSAPTRKNTGCLGLILTLAVLLAAISFFM
jgi:hypothetical protein